MYRIDEDLKTVINEEQGVSMELYNKTYEMYNIFGCEIIAVDDKVATPLKSNGRLKQENHNEQKLKFVQV